MRQPKSLDDAKQMFREERAKIASSLGAIAGSRWLTAILATLALAFGTHVIYAPDRLPPLEWLQWRNVGLPPSVDFGFAGEQWEQAREAAKTSDAAARTQEALAQAHDYYALINGAVFAASLLLLLGNLWLMTKRRRYTRG
jgi:hypothetical protein